MGNLLHYISNDSDDDISLYGDTDGSMDGEFAFSNIELSKIRKYDCILVFNEGSTEKEWKYSQYSTMQYDYLNLLDADDIEDRKNRFPHHGADWAMTGDSTITVRDFNENERKLVIKALKKLNIKCKAIKALNNHDNNTESNREKYKYYYVGMSEERARKWAHEIGYNLELEPDCAVKYLCLNDESLALATMDNNNIMCADIWNNVYIKFDINVAPQIYKEYYGMYGYSNYDKPSLFNTRDRITLINDAITQDIEVGGAGIFINDITNNHCIADFFPLHTLEHLEIILHKLFSLKYIFKRNKIFNLPLKEFRSYFGEYFAIYFAFLQYLTWYYVPLVVVGIIFGLLQLIYDQILMSYLWIFALFVTVWAVLCPIFWKKKELKYAKLWGTLRFNDEGINKSEERARPQFVGDYRTSIIDGTEEEFFDPNVRTARRLIACSVVLTFFIALIGSISAVILLRIYITQTQSTMTLMYGNYMIAAANTLVIMIFNNLYGVIAEKLNAWENYKTETEYENALIIKIFIFRFINSYASLYYIAFFRLYEYVDSPLYCTPEQCMNDLRVQLAFIFLSQLIVNNIMELAPLFIKRCVCVAMSREHNTQGNSFFSVNESDFIYNQYASAVYGRTFDDYCELIIIFGYSTLFLLAFPFAPLFAFIAYIIEARIDGYKLCKLSRRPWPRQCKSIGSWQFALEVMTWAVLITNIFIVCFTTQVLDILPSNVLNNDVYFEEALTSLILMLALVLLVIFLNTCIGGKSYDILTHIHRQNHIEHKLKEIGNNIEFCLDSIMSSNENNFYKWNVDKVALFLHKVLVKNSDEWDQLKYALKQANFDGKAFAECDKDYLEDHFNLGDDQYSFFMKKFILNAKTQLIERQQLADRQNTLIASVSLNESKESQSEHDCEECQHCDISEEDTEYNSPQSFVSYQNTAVQIPKKSPKKLYSKTFNFTNQNLYGMALFFEKELKLQSKHKLWSRIEKDMIDIVQKPELGLLLYLTITVYVKAKYKNEKLPRFSDEKFRKNMLNPLKKWLLECKISQPGLTLQQFNAYYPLWLREYYSLSKSESEYESSNNNSNNGQSQKKSKKRHKSRRERHQFLIPISENKDSEYGENSVRINYALSSEDSMDYNMRSQHWNQDCKEWFAKMNEISQFVNKTLESTRIKIWDKFDKNGAQKLDTSKYLPKLIFYFMILYIKSEYKKSNVSTHSKNTPKYKQLHRLLKYFANDIMKMMPINQKLYITKYHFNNHIHIYFQKIVEKRSKLI